ncbi:MAG: hypothetical protein ACFFD1_14610 [Candidatus Thorarchaeota archaeon]
MSQDENILILQWTGSKFQITKSLGGDETPQILILDKEGVGISYFPNDYPHLEKLNIQRQLDSIKRIGIENPELRKRYRIAKIIEIERTFTLQNVLRTVKKGENYNKALEFETTSFSISTAVQNEEQTSYTDRKGLILEKEINAYKILLQISNTNILLFDASTRTIIANKQLPGTCTKAESESLRGFNYKLVIDNKNYDLNINLLEKSSEIKTGALFIHSLGFKNKLGFFAGSYEAGLFKIENGQIKIDKVIKTDKITQGFYDFDLNLFFIAKMYQVFCYDVTWDEEPKLKWTALVPEMSQGIVSSAKEVGELLFTGHKDGSIQQRDLLNGKLQTTFSYDGDPIKYLSWVGGDIVVSLEKGGLFRISTNGNIKWRSYLPPQNVMIMGITSIKDFLWVTTSTGIIYKIDSNNGRITEQYKDLHPEAFSSLAVLNDEWMIFDYPEQIRWQHVQDTSLKSFITLSDIKIRALTACNTGIIAGDDSGKMIHFKWPGLELIET